MIVLFRHGQCEHNIKNWISCSLESKSELTDFGREVVEESAKELKRLITQDFLQKINFFNPMICSTLDIQRNFKVYASPLLRTRQTAEIICDILGIDKNTIILDERIKEAQYGSYDEGPVPNLPYDVYDMDKFVEQGSESYADINKRLGEFMKDRFDGSDILVVSHALPIREMHKVLTGIQDKVKVGKFFMVK